jgi:hypothetical protein
MNLEIPLLLQARGAEVTFFFAGRIGEATTRAIRGTYVPDRFVAIRADDGVFPPVNEEGLTDGADRREDKVQQPREDAGGPHLKIPGHEARGKGCKRDLDFAG